MAEFRRTKGAVKLHLLLDHDGYLPGYAYISNGKKHDATIARKVPGTDLVEGLHNRPGTWLTGRGICGRIAYVVEGDLCHGSAGADGG